MTVSRGRSAVPSPGRLGLLQPEARDLLVSLGWTGVGSVDVLWSLSRAPDADLALSALVRLREAEPAAWPELDGLLRTDKHFRGRLLSVLGGSDALGDHLVAHPETWRALVDDELPDEVAVRDRLLAAVKAVPEPTAVGHGDLLYRSEITGSEAVAALQRAYRDQVLVLAAHDLAATVENEPVLYLPEVGGRLSSLADAALTAALAVAIATVLGEAGSDSPKPLEIELAVIAMGKCGARELNYVSDVDIVFVAEPADSTSARIAGEMMRIGAVAFFDVDAGLRPEGKSRALTDSGVARRLLPSLGQDLGVPSPLEGPRDDRLDGAGRQVHRSDVVDGVGCLRTRRLRGRGAGDAPTRGVVGSARREAAEREVGSRRASRRRVRGAAAPDGARPGGRQPARSVDGRRLGGVD